MPPNPLQLALQLHQSGRLAEAEAHYRQFLAQNPNHPDALYLLGVVSGQLGRYDVAIDLITKSIPLRPPGPGNHFNLAEFLRRSGKPTDAIPHYRQALALKAAYAEAHFGLASALKDTGQLDDAIASYQNALALKPHYPEAHFNLGNAYQSQKLFPQAIASYRQAITQNPKFASAHCNLASTLADNGQIDDAIQVFHQAIAIDPNLAIAHYNLANTLRDKGTDHAAALAAYDRAIALAPNYAEAHCNRGRVLRDLGRVDDAIASLRQAIAIDLNLAAAHNNLAATLIDAARLDEAAQACKNALALNPNLPEAHNNLGNALMDLGQVETAIAAYQQALILDSHYAKAHSNLVFAHYYHHGDDAQKILDESRNWNTRHAAPLRANIRPHTNTRDPDRKPKIAYLSPDLHLHSVAFFLLPLLENHDRSHFHITALYNNSITDNITERMNTCTDRWHTVTRLTDPQLADLIRHEQIDILIDLAGHSAGGRLLALAPKPAPLQLSYLGFPGTTGVDAIDYRISDPYADPPGQTDAFTTEKILRLPRTAWCFTPLSGSPPIAPPPAIKNNFITFGTFNNFAKVSPHILTLWAQLLHRVRTSRLILKNAAMSSPSALQRLREFFTTQNIPLDRLTFIAREPLVENHLRLYDRIDIALDTYPYHGTTTTCEALWMGVPVITRAGPTHVARVGASLLNNLGHLGAAELIANSDEDYITLAATLANDLPKLTALRTSLRHQLQSSPLSNAPQFARDVEQAYHQVWNKWCQSANSQSLS